MGPNLLRSPLFWLQLALVYAVTFSCRLAEHGGGWVFRPRDDMILAEREQMAEERKRRKSGSRGGSGSGGLRKRSKQKQKLKQRDFEAEVEGGNGEVEAPVAGVYPSSFSASAAVPAFSSSSTV